MNQAPFSDDEPVVVPNGNGKAPSRKDKVKSVSITPPELWHAKIGIVGISPLAVNHFGMKSRTKLMEQMQEGQRAKNTRRIRDPRDFDSDYESACYIAHEGWYGFAASSIRNASISACRVAGMVMTKAKLSIFCEADGFDRIDGEPLVRITEGEPQPWIRPVVNTTGVVDLRVRPKWEPGWRATLSLSWDSNQFNVSDILNLLERAGLQVGIGEGRPDSKQSNGLGFGRFIVDRDMGDLAISKFNPAFPSSPVAAVN